jgi:hypothetical protein
MTAHLIDRISPETVALVVDHLNRTVLEPGLLQPDVSRYAVGRQRLWLNRGWDLGARRFMAGHQDPTLWSWCQRLWPDAELGLIVYGSVGIDRHRDDSYADYRAVSINLGEVGGWGFQQFRDHIGPGPQTERPPIVLRPKPGTIIEFNCKDPHWVESPAPDRWGINLWSVAPKYRDLFDAGE